MNSLKALLRYSEALDLSGLSRRAFTEAIRDKAITPLYVGSLSTAYYARDEIDHLPQRLQEKEK